MQFPTRLYEDWTVLEPIAKLRGEQPSVTSTPFDIGSLHAAYAGGLAVETMVDTVLARIDEVGDHGIFIHLESRGSILEQAQALGPFDPKDKPLWGIPFAIKDNIDVAGAPTTAACPAYAYEAESDAVCVAALRGAGAILIGKTNLDQFATGLVGLRTPYPVPRNAIDPAVVPGGSSSGSAVAVARGIVSFALGTDTAGSGRVPAGLNNIVGLKPTLGTISSTGVVPACRSLDTVSIFALTVDDACAVFAATNGYDREDPYARTCRIDGVSPLPPTFKVGVPDRASRWFFGDEPQALSFAAALLNIERLGGTIVELDFAPFYDIARMLYEGAWVAERYAVVEDLLAAQPGALHPVTREIIERAATMSAADAFRDIYRLELLKRQAQPLIASVDMLCVPTIARFYTVAEIEADPIGPNARLGTYTNFVNLLDMCGIAVPTGARSDERPGSVTLLAEAGADARLAALARQLHALSGARLGATDWPMPATHDLASAPAEHEIELAVVGAHMSGLPLNQQLTSLGARFLKVMRTAPCYRLFRLAGGSPARPGLVRDSGGDSIELETWAIPKARFGEFIATVPAPLVIGTVTLETREQVKGFLCEPAGLDQAVEITEFGGWRHYVASVKQGA
jgi:allophanate hydrolase